MLVDVVFHLVRLPILLPFPISHRAHIGSPRRSPQGAFPESTRKALRIDSGNASWGMGDAESQRAICTSPTASHDGVGQNFGPRISKPFILPKFIRYSQPWTKDNQTHLCLVLGPAAPTRANSFETLWKPLLASWRPRSIRYRCCKGACLCNGSRPCSSSAGSPLLNEAWWECELPSC